MACWLNLLSISKALDEVTYLSQCCLQLSLCLVVIQYQASIYILQFLDGELGIIQVQSVDQACLSYFVDLQMTGSTTQD